MIDTVISTWNHYIALFSGGNEFAAAALSVWVLTLATYILRSVPQAIYHLLKRQLTTTITMNNGGYDEKATMIHFMSWVLPKMNESWSRTLSVDSDNETSIGLGYGIHFFFWDMRLFWLYKNKLDSSGSERQKEEITIGTVGRSHAPFYKMKGEFTPMKDGNRISIYHLDYDGDWMRYSKNHQTSV
jgi:hypothetical protein